ncbi:MAG: cation-transporting P-type ATPase [Roseitalea sp.]|nr:cation-transporting P-type ATPase [Roseitalea sp.]MBO6722408.1 cation-transporting P-type ATPase [Roseitalea sp.]MBO6741978.1 cation-transporting P-type ATPase [Roseitalea sp.]
MSWHDQPFGDALTRFGTRIEQGLDETGARQRLAHYGPNKLPEPKRAGPLGRFVRQFHNVLIYVLLAAGATTALLGHWIDTAVILAVVMVNAIIGFVQEGKAESALAAIRDMLAPRATVLRDGHRHTVPGEDIVPGDVVIVEAGDRIPADLRLCETRGLKIEEAVLTGESVPVDKATGPVAADAPLGDRRSMAFSGTMAAAGQGRGIAVATAADTEIGRISGMIADVPSTETPLIRQMAVFAKWLTAFIIGFSALILAFGLTLGGYGFTELFMALVGLSVAAIPEGLPAILTVTLAIGVQGMARRNAIVRRLPAIEALGSVSVICSDKTGTLTKNEMTVAGVITANHAYSVTGTGYAPHGGFVLDGAEARVADHPVLTELGRAALLCNEADLVGAADNWQVVGDPMEGALVAFACKAGFEPDTERARRPQTDAIPFDAQHRFMASLRHDHEGNATIFVKGAPERLLAMCRTQRIKDGTNAPIDPDYWRDQAAATADQGQRVLAIAVKRTHGDHGELHFDDVDNDLTLLGLVGLIDPPREEAIDAVRECRAAGIAVKMITGDHAGTAAAIGRQLGLANTARVMEGAEIDTLDTDQLRGRAAEVDIFARTSPQHKLRLVEALQEGGAVVAMTGDGVNDAPALKRADIGIAMGLKGTEAAKEASEIVLADDNFATIAAAVKAGRTVYDNLKKAIIFLLPVNGGESLSLVAAILLGLTLPITPLQILWVNMVSSVLLAMTLAFEASERGVMTRAPRPASEPILSPFVLWRVGFVSVLFMAGIFGKFALAQAQGSSIEEARTIAVNTLVVMEIFYLFSVRYLGEPSLTLRGLFGTRPVLIAIAAVTALQFLFTYAPFMEAFFDTRPVSLLQGLQIVAVGIAVLVILELEKRAVWAWRGRRGTASHGERARARG